MRHSEERFRAFVTASSDVIYRMNADWTQMRYLQGKEFIADTQDPSEGWLTKYIHPEDQLSVLAVAKEAIRTKSPFDLEHRVIRVDGSLGWTHSRAIPILGSGEEIIEWFGAARDITDQKKAQETQQLLLNELNHRVKNMLASVDAIAQQTLRRSKDPASFAASFSGRLRSMSRMHSLLTGGGWEGADLREIIRDQILPSVSDEKRIDASGPSIQLEPQTAMHVAMMLHELGTNSVKYGALSNTDGSVSVSWSIVDNSLRLDWREQGGPAIKVPLGRGFGTTLIELTVKGHEGSARRTIAAGGLQWEIILPLRSHEASKEKTKSAKHPVTQGDQKQDQSTLPRLVGKKIAVIEDESVIAANIAMILEDRGGLVAGPVGNVREALNLIEKAEIDGALLDANLRGDSVEEIAVALTKKGVPFIFVSGYGAEGLPPSFARTTILRKPFSDAELVEAASRLVDKPEAVTRMRESDRGQ